MLQSKKQKKRCCERTLYTKCQHRNSCKIAKQKTIIDAQTETEKTRELTKADAIFAKKWKQKQRFI
jgi:hypothetical protein